MSLTVAASHLTKSFDFDERSLTVVRDLSFEVGSGEFVAVVGPSGCGKSTVLNILGLADRPSSGEVSLAGVPVNYDDEGALVRLRRSAVGFVFQHFNLLPTLTALENVMLPLMLNGTAARIAEERATELLGRVGLLQRAKSLPFRLSGGEMQRVAVARAVVHRPTLVLADEPTGNLDSASGDAVLDLLAELVSDGTTVLMATHSEAAVDRCSRVLRLLDGALV
jgi:putative ABC transport system ATP-binding protein